MDNKKELSAEQKEALLKILKIRFEKNIARHKDIIWDHVLIKLETNTEKLWSLNEMENTGGEPDVIEYDERNNEYLFYDCSAESPKGRRSFCYDQEALEERKEHKPLNSALGMANDMGIEILSEKQYRTLQQYGKFDQKTSSWIKTPPEIRILGGALFADYRYETVFLYHNGAQSYYAARGFRGLLRI